MSAQNDQADSALYSVVVNHEEQYSLWPLHQPMPAGWIATGKEGSRAECLEYVDEVWTDMRPLSLRTSMAQKA